MDAEVRAFHEGAEGGLGLEPAGNDGAAERLQAAGLRRRADQGANLITPRHQQLRERLADETRRARQGDFQSGLS